MARLIAIDLGAYAVKASVLLGAARSHELEGEYKELVPQDGTSAPSLQQRLAALDRLLSRHPELETATLATATWSGDRSTVHRVSMPFTDSNQIEQTLPFTIEAEVPFELDEMVVGWRSEATEAGSDIIAVLAPRGPLKVMLDELAERSLDPRQVIADGDVLSAYAPDTGTLHAVIDVGHDHTVVSVCRHGRTAWYRTISVAGASLTRAIQQAMSCTWSEAEAIKHARGEQGESAETPEAARQGLNSVIGLLLAEIRSTLIQAEDSLGEGIDSVLLTGGGARLPELRMWLQQDLGVEIADLVDVDGSSVQAGFAASRALAWHQSGERELATVDLRVGDFAFRGGMDLARGLMLYGGVGVGCFALAVVLMFGIQFNQLTAEQRMVDARMVDEVTNAVPELAGVDMDSTTALSTMASIVDDARREADFLGDGSEVPETIDLLYQLTEAFPPHPQVTVDLSQIDIKTAAINIQGETTGFSSLDAIESSVKANPMFSSLVKTPGSKTPKGKIKFTLDIDRTADGDALPEEG